MEVHRLLHLSAWRILLVVIVAAATGIATAVTLVGNAEEAYTARGVVFLRSATPTGRDAFSLEPFTGDVETALALPEVQIQAAQAAGLGPSDMDLEFQRGQAGSSLEVIATAATPDQAQTIVTEVVRIALTEVLDQDLARAERQLEEAETRVIEAEAAIETFRVDNDTRDPLDDYRLSVQALRSIELQLLDPGLPEDTVAVLDQQRPLIESEIARLEPLIDPYQELDRELNRSETLREEPLALVASIDGALNAAQSNDFLYVEEPEPASTTGPALVGAGAAVVLVTGLLIGLLLLFDALMAWRRRRRRGPEPQPAPDVQPSPGAAGHAVEPHRDRAPVGAPPARPDLGIEAPPIAPPPTRRVEAPVAETPIAEVPWDVPAGERAEPTVTETAFAFTGGDPRGTGPEPGRPAGPTWISTPDPTLDLLWDEGMEPLGRRADGRRTPKSNGSSGPGSIASAGGSPDSSAEVTATGLHLNGSAGHAATATEPPTTEPSTDASATGLAATAEGLGQDVGTDLAPDLEIESATAIVEDAPPPVADADAAPATDATPATTDAGPTDAEPATDVDAATDAEPATDVCATDAGPAGAGATTDAGASSDDAGATSDASPGAEQRSGAGEAGTQVTSLGGISVYTGPDGTFDAWPPPPGSADAILWPPPQASETDESEPPDDTDPPDDGEGFGQWPPPEGPDDDDGPGAGDGAGLIPDDNALPASDWLAELESAEEAEAHGQPPPPRPGDAIGSHLDILQVDKFLRPYGGAAIYMFDLADQLQARGHRVEYFSVQHPENRESSLSDTFPPDTTYDPPPDGMGNKIRAAAAMTWSNRAAKGMAKALDRYRPDLVHLHNIYHQLSPSILAPIHHRGIPMVMTLHDFKLICPSYRMHDGTGPCEACLGGNFMNAASRRCKSGSLAQSTVLAIESTLHRQLGAYDAIDAFVCPSTFLRDKLVEGGFDERRLRHIPNFTTVEPVAESGPRGEHILSVGRLSAEKGLETLIEACGRAPARRLRIVGDGPEREGLEALAARVAPETTEFVGQVEREQVIRELDEARAIVFPARGYENMPVAILEAMARATPVIVTDIGGSPELLAEPASGLCVPPEDPEALRAAIDRLDDADFAAQLGAAGVEKVRTTYSPAVHVEAIEALYRQLGARVPVPAG